MKGISAVIATILMLLITIALAGLAYLYISGMFTGKTGTLVEIDPAATSCAGTQITVYVKNSGSIGFTAEKLQLSGTTSTGGVMTGGTCNSTSQPLAPLLVPMGGAVWCDRTLAGTQGNNKIMVSGPSNTATGSVYCTG
jgi:flagellin-like protein